MTCTLCEKEAKRMVPSRNLCRSCDRKVTWHEFLGRKYDYIRKRCKEKPNYQGRLNISRQGFIQKFKHNKAAIEMHRVWVESGFKRHLNPSVDRIDPEKDYERSNIQIIPQYEHDRKSKKEQPSRKKESYILKESNIGSDKARYSRILSRIK